MSGDREREGGAAGSAAASESFESELSEGAGRVDAAEPGARAVSRSARRPLAPGLHIVSTPIGNADDVTLRALDVLARADAIAAEDTRTTQRLMEIHGIARAGRPLVPYHDRNGETARPGILAWLRDGLSVAYCSEAGTPLIADPGYRLVEAAAAEGLGVTAAPGVSAAVVALTLSGLPTDRFLFAGFLPPKRAARRSALAELAPVPATLVFYESPNRVAASLADMAETLGQERPAAIARELTKRFEEVRRGALGTLAAELASEPTPRGEIVIALGRAAAAARETTAEALDAFLENALGRMPVSEAARAAAAELGVPRRQAYARALEIGGK